ncbi:MAG: hypothetical protein HYX51_06285 [Chloroflexi bacterium]|nr:hypothetical protein [Chloroflexota bacterium]
MGDGVLIADFDYGCIRRVGTNGRISTFAGVCGSGFQFNPANGTPKAATAMGGPIGLTRLPGGAILYAEQFAHRVRKIEEGKVTTVAGVGANGFYAGSFGGDGGPATAARLNLPSDVQAAVGGGFLISDRWNNRVRWVSDDGMIRTIAGTGPDMLPTTPNFGGDGGPATAAKLNGPHAIDVRHDGSILIADLENRRIRQVSPLETKNTAPPTITGAPSVGQTLTCNPGTWTNNPAFTYQWISDGDRIRGATGPTYVVRDRDRDDRIRCVVEASTYSGTERARSGSVRVP